MGKKEFVIAVARGARGKDAAKALFLPDTLIMKSNDLPDEYEKLSGITFASATYYKITDFRLTGADTLRFSFKASKACNVIGCYTTTSAETNYSVYASTSSGAKYLRYNGGTYYSMITANTRYDVIITPTGATGLAESSTWIEKEFEAESDFCIGTTSPGATSAKLDGVMYGSIKVDGKLNLIPCKRKTDDVIGYYDTIGKTFYEPTGSAPTEV